MSRKAAQRLISDAASASQASPEGRWQAAFGCPAPIRPAGFLEAAFAWRAQVLAHGDIAPAIADKLDHAADAVRASRVNCAGALVDQVHAPRANSGAATHSQEDSRVRAPCTQTATAASRVTAPRTKPAVQAGAFRSAPSELPPGTRLVKIHGGQTHVVEVTAGGMLYQDQLYSSLSAVAKAITSTHWNGLLFFGLRKRKTYPKASG